MGRGPGDSRGVAGGLLRPADGYAGAEPHPDPIGNARRRHGGAPRDPPRGPPPATPASATTPAAPAPAATPAAPKISTASPRPISPTPAPTPATPPPTTTASPRPIPPTPAPTATASPTSQPQPTATPSPRAVATETPAASEPTEPPDPPRRNLYELARSLRLKSAEPIVRSSYGEPVVLQEGHRQSFNVLLDHYELDFGKIGATLERVSPSAYWYFQDGVRFEEDDLDRAVQALEERIIPALAAGFGPLWPPDAPPGQRITILNAPSRGLAGYYSSADEYPAVVHQNSNEQKMILMNPTNLGVGSVDYLSTLAHELQHAVNWNVNGGQSSWLNEGLSQVAEHRMGWEPWSVPAYIHSAPVSVVYWPITPGGRAPNYGASFLFTQFMLDQLGSPANLAPLIKTGQRGENAVTAYLRSLGSGETFESLFGRWTVASYLGRQGEGPYDYADSWPPAFSTDTLDSHGSLAFWQPQYSARYIRLDTDAGGLEVSFSGQAQAPILPVEPASGGRCWWGNRDDGMSTTLTRGFDLTGVESATLEFSMWHEIEEGWDYAYVMVSRDGGVTWDILQGGRSSLENPSQNAYGPGYTGTTDGWVEDSVDLSPYAGAEVLVRFHYVTDDAANGVGICIDSVSIPDLDFHDDASTNLGWTSNGFFRADNRTAQGFTVHLIETKGGESVVTPVLLNDANAGAVRVSDLSALDEAVLVVGSLAPHSSQPARYVVTLAKAE